MVKGCETNNETPEFIIIWVLISYKCLSVKWNPAFSLSRVMFWIEWARTKPQQRTLKGF